MPGPPPKPAKLRQRRNKTATHATIAARPRKPQVRVPDLFERRCACGGAPEPPAPGAKKRRGRPPKPRPPCARCLGTGVLPWHRLTLAWWRDVWTSEVKDEYLEVDMHGLYRLAVLVDRYWRESDEGIGVRELGAEIRLQQQAYGITPLDRTRLQWEVEKPDAEKRPGPPDDPPMPERPTGTDARAILRAVK